MSIVSPWKTTPRRLKKWKHRALRYLRKAFLVCEPKEHKKMAVCRRRKSHQKAKRLDRRIGA